ncbi:MAG: SDR family oxidoreductase [Gemmatimonadota bacterium]|nr:SDR family oxidoreductase [Gemmatimonadota bacterium]
MEPILDRDDNLVLVTGATGYVGGRLVPRLLAAGYRVRCVVRDPARMEGRSWLPQVELMRGDVLDPSSLVDAVRGAGSAYYLVHSLAGGEAFHERDVSAARNFATAFRDAGGRHIVYLGGLGDSTGELSPHLRSRQATGDTLRESGVAVTELRAAVIVGSGSLSFEIIRYLAERVPVMICPSWVYTRVQPIAIENVLDYLVAALRLPSGESDVIEIGGADVITYGEMMMGYARVRGLRRWMLPVPVLTPRLSSYWVHLVTPVPSRIAQPLIEGLRNEVVLHDDRARTLFPGIVPMNYAASVQQALLQLDAGDVETAWSGALSTSHRAESPVILTEREGMVREQRQLRVKASPSRVFRAFTSLGGRGGWLYMNWAWQLRGMLDRMLGGVGMRRGRRDPVQVRPGDAIDFWRVESVVADRLLRLRAEMKVPGRAWLEFAVAPDENGETLLSQTAIFAPRGLSGWLYWYGLYPIHALIFSGMIRAVGAAATARID